jgi:hypothetical protein
VLIGDIHKSLEDHSHVVVLNSLDKMENKLCVVESKIEPSIGTST